LLKKRVFEKFDDENEIKIDFNVGLEELIVNELNIK